MVQEIDGNDDKITSSVPQSDRAAHNASWICGEVGHYANECPHNLSNVKNRGSKKTSMDKKGGECTYTITGKEPVSERVMNTILNGMMREHRGQLQVQHKYQRFKKAVTSSEDSGIGSVASQVGSAPEVKNQDDDQKDKTVRKGQRGRPTKSKNEKKNNARNTKKDDDETTLKNSSN